MSEGEPDLTKPIDLMTICAEMLDAPNRFYSHGVEHAQIEAAEMILENVDPPEADEAGRFVSDEDPRRTLAVQFLRGIAQGLGQGGVTARMRAVKALLKGGAS